VVLLLTPDPGSVRSSDIIAGTRVFWTSTISLEAGCQGGLWLAGDRWLSTPFGSMVPLGWTDRDSREMGQIEEGV
jgi:hypothetical protein